MACCCAIRAAELRLRVAKDAEDFSHVPVRDAGSKVVGVVYRDTLIGSSGTAASVMRELDQRQLVDATAPLRDTLSLLTHSGFLLVTSHTSGMPDRISGIINHSDVQKTPVRLLLFARITEIEARLRSRLLRIEWETIPACAWAVTRASKQRLRWANAPLPLVNYLNITDLGALARQCNVTLNPSLSEDEHVRVFIALKAVRNNLAHTNDVHCGETGEPLDPIEAINEAFNTVDAAFGPNPPLQPTGSAGG